MKINTFSRFTKDTLAHLDLAPATKEILRVVGLPTAASPYLYFGDFDGVSLPRLKDWPWLKATPPEEYKDYIVIGEGGDNDNRPICIKDDSEQVVILDQDKAFECVLMNSSLLQLVAVLNSYRAMVEEAISTFESWAYKENRVPQDLIETFEEELDELDPLVLTGDSFWTLEIGRLKGGLQKFEAMQKYQFELISQLCEESETIHLRKITVAAEAPVIRAIAEFLSQCADGIEEWGQNWDHEHFRDYWPEWYSKYPDIVIVQFR